MGDVAATVVVGEISNHVCIASGPLPAGLQERESARNLCSPAAQKTACQFAEVIKKVADPMSATILTHPTCAWQAVLCAFKYFLALTDLLLSLQRTVSHLFSSITSSLILSSSEKGAITDVQVMKCIMVSDIQEPNL